MILEVTEKAKSQLFDSYTGKNSSKVKTGLFFKFDYLEVMSEDQVLVSFINWYTQNHKNIQPGAASNILDNIRWNHVSFKTLHKVISENNEIKCNQDIRRIFKNELERRVRELLQDRDSSDMYGVYLQKREPRKSYITHGLSKYLFNIL